MKKNTKFLLKLICALACAFFVCTFSSCATKSFSETRDKVTTKLYKKGKTIRIACASSWEVNDSLQWQGLELAQKEINDAGGVHGAKIELIKTDDKKDKKEA